LYRRGERTLGVMPLYHTMGVRSLLAMALVDGAFVCLPRFDAAAALALIARERITNLYLVPTLYHDLIAHLDFAATDVSSVRKLGFAGAAMPDGLLRRVEAAFRPELFVNHYGSSEIYTFTIEPNAASTPGSAGKAGLNQRIRVVRLGGEAPAAPGEEGEIVADSAGDEAFAGYWNRPDADAKALRGGWYFTGDTGYIDAEGDLFVTGRVDDMIVSGGENISPGEIENVLSRPSRNRRSARFCAACSSPATTRRNRSMPDGFRVVIDAARERADVILDRPPLNVITMAEREELRAAFEALDADEAVRVITLRGAGEHFSSGGEISGFLAASPEHVSRLAWNIAAPARCRKPVVAASRGYCFGVGF